MKIEKIISDLFFISAFALATAVFFGIAIIGIANGRIANFLLFLMLSFVCAFIVYHWTKEFIKDRKSKTRVYKFRN